MSVAASRSVGLACRRPRRSCLYLAVALVAGAVIGFQIFIMRVFAVGSWTHFGSFVVALAACSASASPRR